ncbi:hypothetical protein OHA18_07340 [Kribbella sp. NBC_00709]|uniref:hypothetical protein n=1 Tax=Kribbella sp. NBC_00709 TaxID=2975972 RepID=UPI002E2BF1CA|nr:hypothetical protein [Kribbella sp. NBC_00709]
MRRTRQPAMSIVQRTATRLAVVLSVVTAITVAVAGPSSAVTNAPEGPAVSGGDVSVTSTNAAGWAHFDADTNTLSIHDSHADGYGVVVVDFRSDLANPGPYRGWNREGAGTTTYYPLHMPYGATFKFVVCSEQDGLQISSTCSAQVTGSAGPAL